MEIRKPGVLVSFLDFLVFYFQVPPFNINFFGIRLASQGDWMNWTLDLGEYVEVAIDTILLPINAAISLVEAGMVIWSKFWDIYDEIMDIISLNLNAISIWFTEEIGGLWDKLTGDLRQVWDTIWTLTVEVATLMPRVAAMIAGEIQASTLNIHAWVADELASLADTILDPWKQVLNTVSLFVEDINDLFSDPEEWLYDKIDSMLDRFW